MPAAPPPFKPLCACGHTPTEPPPPPPLRCPLWPAAAAAAATRLALFGQSLYALDACDSFREDVQVVATASIPLADVVVAPGGGERRRGGTWRLREVTAGVAAADRVELGRVAVQLAYFPLHPPAPGD